MNKPALSVVSFGAQSPADAAMQLQQQAKAAADAVTADLLDALTRAAVACEASQSIEAVKRGVRDEARILAPKIRQVLARMESIGGRG